MTENTNRTAPLLRTRRPRTSRRGAWAIVVHLTALAGLVVEANTHLCRDALRLDPLKDAVTIGFFLLAAAMLIVNEYALRLRWRRIPWLRAAALIGTGVALPVAVGTAVVFVPILPLSIPLLFFYGLGALAWVPLLASVILLVQLRALWLLGWESAQHGLPSRRIIIASALSFLTAVGWVMPLLLER